MAKQDVLDAINATIAPNNIKGITAESLNNVLTMMAENAGEGSGGDGALRVIVPDLIVFGGEIVGAGELSPSSWAAMRPELEASLGLDLSEYEEVVNASFAHNANVAQQILAKAKEGQSASVVLDHNPYLPTAIDLLFQIDPGMAALYGDVAACVFQPAALSMQYVKLTPDAEEASGMAGEQLMCSLNPLAPPTLPEYSMLYPSNMDIVLNLDGSLTFTPIEEEQPSSGSGVVTFYVSLSGVSSGEMKSNNKASYESWIANKETSVIIRIEDGGEYTYAYPISTMFSDNLLKVYYIPPTITDGKVSIKGVSIQADGLATHYSM
jgi:hypothetical protein